MKKLFICFDGTSNTYDAAYTTNVVKLHKSAAPFDVEGHEQSAFYIEGVGTRFGSYTLGGAFGKGLFKKVLEGYECLVRHVNEDPDTQLFICGFSRGAYSARSMAGLIGLVGILKSGDEDQIAAASAWYKQRKSITSDKASKRKSEFMHWRAENSPDWCANADDKAWRAENGYPDVPVYQPAYLGIWDTVKTLGLLEGKYKWHDHDLSRHVRNARHAVAIDERRRKFNYVTWDNIDALNAARGHPDPLDETAPYQQKWYPGDHGSVGGGGPVTGLSDDALTWILDGAEQAGFRFHGDHGLAIFEIRPNPLAPLSNREGAKPSLTQKISGKMIGLFGEIDRKGRIRRVDLSRSARLRYFAEADLLPEKRLYRPKTIKPLFAELNAGVPDFSADDYRVLVENVQGTGIDPDEEKYVNMISGRYRIHIVRKGDTLSELARQYLGNAADYMKIYNANRVALDDPDKIYVDMRLFIPVPLAH